MSALKRICLEEKEKGWRERGWLSWRMVGKGEESKKERRLNSRKRRKGRKMRCAKSI